MRRALLLFCSLALFAACSTPDEVPDFDDEGERPEAVVPALPPDVANDTVGVRLYSYGFEVNRDTLIAGRTYHFLIDNDADIPHEWVLVPEGARDEDEALLVVEEDELADGATARRTFAFTEPGNYAFACFLEEPKDHYEQGMVRPITVVAP